MRTILLIAVSALFISCSHSTKYVLAHGEDTRTCNPKDTAFLTCLKCGENAYSGPMIPTTVQALMNERDRDKYTFFMFYDPGCPAYPNTMKPYLEKVAEMDSITPRMVIVDEYRDLPAVRKHLNTWGWTGPVHVLDQDHYGCFRFFASNKNGLVMKEFGIEEDSGYSSTVHLMVLVDPAGQVVGYSNWHDLPNALRGGKLPE